MGSKFHELLHPIEIRDRDLAGQAVAIDGTAWLHQFLKVTIYNPNDPGNRLVLLDKTCRLINHLRGFLYSALHLLQHGIWPVYVFDGATRYALGTVAIRQWWHRSISGAH